jgi:putative intracellular protease/amidase
MKNLIAVLALMIAGQVVQAQTAQPKKVLVVLSSENKITLQNGVVHPTGYFLSELMVPAMALEKAGYQLVFANPKGNAPTMDVVSDKAFWFSGNEEFQEVKRRLALQKDFNQPLTLREVRAQGLEQFAGIFLPGGHAPMEDLLKDQDLGAILKYFHQAQKPTALICHAPIALLSTLDNPEAYEDALARKSEKEMALASQNWIYKGYELTAFSTKEEQQEEVGGDNILGGLVRFYPDEALGFAGAKALVNATKWKSNVRVDRELITGQNPYSDHDLARELIKALNK